MSMIQPVLVAHISRRANDRLTTLEADSVCYAHAAIATGDQQRSPALRHRMSYSMRMTRERWAPPTVVSADQAGDGNAVRVTRGLQLLDGAFAVVPHRPS